MMMLMRMNLRLCSCASHPPRAPPLFSEGSADTHKERHQTCGEVSVPQDTSYVAALSDLWKASSGPRSSAAVAFTEFGALLQQQARQRSKGNPFAIRLGLFVEGPPVFGVFRWKLNGQPPF